MVQLIETDKFPIEFLSAVGERESWRKEVNRPIYHVHKWWAKRLGSVFRGILLGCVLPEQGDLEQAFYRPTDAADVSVYDPFMGSGTTIGEAHKLGCAALGRDINPVACESVRVALGPLNRDDLQAAYASLYALAGQSIRALYQTQDGQGQVADVLYYFWVKHVPCLYCGARVELFSTRVIARNAYPDRKPEVQVCCPQCGEIFPALNTDRTVRCRFCASEFDPQQGATDGTNATCPVCLKSFAVIAAVRETDQPPAHRLYGKLILMPDGSKRYLAATGQDVEAYHECSRQLQAELQSEAIRVPRTALTDGYNTRQAIGYNYRLWRQFFNDRQLLALGWLHEAIARLPQTSTRDAFALLFSGVLEFNNVFASYKGEGTGAVRHMFAHHVLKPERMPIEANVWGTPKSSGSFSNLFKSRLLRAVDYRAAPFEVALNDSGKAHYVSAPFSGRVETTWPPPGELRPRSIYLSCGSSDKTDLPDQCVDLVVTDPPFFDNVHYSELADFFYSWQSLFPRGFIHTDLTTRHPDEVQDGDAARFASKLQAVLAECRRVLKDDGLLAFTYHHSRPEGWSALLEAIVGAGFSIVNAHPVKSEMSVAVPKAQARDPIQLDIVLVCRKTARDTRSCPAPSRALARAAARAGAKLDRLASVGLRLSQNDRKIVLVSQFLAELGPILQAEAAVAAFVERQADLDGLVEKLPTAQRDPALYYVPYPPPAVEQLHLFESRSEGYLDDGEE